MPVELPPTKTEAGTVSRPSFRHASTIAFTAGFALVLGALLLVSRWP